MMLFDIRNAIVSLCRDGFIKPLDYQSTLNWNKNQSLKKSIGERTILRKQRLN